MATADANFESQSGEPIAATIGAFATNLDWKQVPEETRTRAKLLILDALGIAIAANRYPFAESILSSLSSLAEIDGAAGTCRVVAAAAAAADAALPLADAAGLIPGVAPRWADRDERRRLAKAARKVSIENADALERISGALAPFVDALPGRS